MFINTVVCSFSSKHSTLYIPGTHPFLGIAMDASRNGSMGVPSGLGSMLYSCMWGPFIHFCRKYRRRVMFFGAVDKESAQTDWSEGAMPSWSLSNRRLLTSIEYSYVSLHGSKIEQDHSKKRYASLSDNCIGGFELLFVITMITVPTLQLNNRSVKNVHFSIINSMWIGTSPIHLIVCSLKPYVIQLWLDC